MVMGYGRIGLRAGMEMLGASSYVDMLDGIWAVWYIWNKWMVWMMEECSVEASSMHCGTIGSWCSLASEEPKCNREFP